MTFRRDLAAAAFLTLLAIGIGLHAYDLAYDDAWITFRYARHLATGQGLVYNVGERFLGTTAAGYAVLLGILGAPSPDAIPAISNALCVVALAAAGVGLYAFGRRAGHRLGGLLAGAFFVVNPIALDSFGGEMLAQTALAVWAFVAQAGGRPTLAALLAGGAAVLRPDGLLVLALVAAWEAWRIRAVPWRPLMPAAVLLGVWFGALWLYFGSPLPQTLAAKHAQRASGLWQPFTTDLVTWVGAFGTGPAPGFTALLGLAALGVPAMLWMRHWWPLVAWPAAVVFAYRQLDVPFYHLYAVPPLAAVVCLPLARLTVTQARGAPLVVERAYADIGRWLARETPPSSSVGYLEIGIVGYHAQRTIVDPLGLVNPGMAAHVARRDLLYAYRTHRPDVIVHNPAFFAEFLDALLNEPWFQAEYERVTTLASGREEPVTIYIRRPVPAPPRPAP